MPVAQAQIKTWRTDSLQFKVYTRMHVNNQLQVDTIVIKKVFCDYCSENQIKALEFEAYKKTLEQRFKPKYYKPGEHRLALYIRTNKNVFQAIETPK